MESLNNRIGQNDPNKRWIVWMKFILHLFSFYRIFFFPSPQLVWALPSTFPYGRNLPGSPALWLPQALAEAWGRGNERQHSVFIPSFPSLQSAGQLWPCFSIKIFFSATVATSLSGFSNCFVPSGLELLMLVIAPLLLVPAPELPHLVSIFHNTANLLPHLGIAYPSFLTDTKNDDDFSIYILIQG